MYVERGATADATWRRSGGRGGGARPIGRVRSSPVSVCPIDLAATRRNTTDVSPARGSATYVRAIRRLGLADNSRPGPRAHRISRAIPPVIGLRASGTFRATCDAQRKFPSFRATRRTELFIRRHHGIGPEPQRFPQFLRQHAVSIPRARSFASRFLFLPSPPPPSPEAFGLVTQFRDLVDDLGFRVKRRERKRVIILIYDMCRVISCAMRDLRHR